MLDRIFEVEGGWEIPRRVGLVETGDGPALWYVGPWQTARCLRPEWYCEELDQRRDAGEWEPYGDGDPLAVEAGQQGVFEDFLALTRTRPHEERVDALPGFLDRRTEQVRDYARRFGPLTLCDEHGLPVDHLGAESCGRANPEPLSYWWWWSHRAAATLRAANLLRDGDLGSWGDTWRWLAVPQERWDQVARGRASPEPLSRYLDDALDSWLSLARLAPRFQWNAGQPEIRAFARSPTPLFAALARHLAFAVCDVDGLAVCDNPSCREPFVPETKPRSDRRTFCPDCQRSAVPENIRQREWRARRRFEEELRRVCGEPVSVEPAGQHRARVTGEGWPENLIVSAATGADALKPFADGSGASEEGREKVIQAVEQARV